MLNITMLNFSDFYIIKESFDTISDFMTSSERSDKNYDEIIDEFKRNGGEIVGYGSFGIVYSHPKWPYILKLFKSDDPYLKFVRYAYDNPHPSFPKFYGKPQRVIPNRITTEKGKEKFRYLSRIEKLHPISDDLFQNIDFKLIDYFEYVNGTKNIDDNFHEMKQNVERLPKEIYNLLEGLYLIRSNLSNISLDIHGGNVMIRNDGQYVWIDPVSDGVRMGERDTSLMIPETFKILKDKIDEINSKINGSKVEIKIHDNNMYDLNLIIDFDISKCNLENLESLQQYGKEISEYFDAGDVDWWINLTGIDVKNDKLELILNMVNFSNMDNIRIGLAILKDIPDYVDWIDSDVRPDICEILNSILY